MKDIAPKAPTPPPRPAMPKLTGLLKPYLPFIATIIALTVAGSSLNLWVPKIISHAIDDYTAGNLLVGRLVTQFLIVAVGLFTFTYLQYVAQTYAAERVARDLRTRIVAKLATQDLAYINRVGGAVLLTNLTSDVDSVKMFVSQAVGSIASSDFPDPRHECAAADDRLEARAGRHRGAAGDRHLLQGDPRARARAVPEGAAGGGSPEQGHQREHPRVGADPAAQLAAPGARQVRRGGRQRPRHRDQHPAPVRQPDPDHRVQHQHGHVADPDPRRALRDQRRHEPRRLHRVQQLPRDRRLSGDRDRVHEQRDRAGRRVLRAHRVRAGRAVAEGGRRDRRRPGGRHRREGRHGGVRREEGAARRLARRSARARGPR